MSDHPIDRLFQRIQSRKGADPKSSYTAQLLAKGPVGCAKKLIEEAGETALAAAGTDKSAVANESADLIYHLLVLWAAAGLTPDDVYAALKAREGQSGLEEKASRKP